MSNVLVVAAHMDDEMGFGGTIAKHVADDDEVTILFLCGREYNRVHSEEVNAEEWKCAEEAQKILGYKNAIHPTPMLRDGDLDIISIRDIIGPIESVIGNFTPDIAYVPWKDDVHQDHKRVFEACMIAMRPISKVKIPKIYCYETPSTTDQNPWMHSFRPNVFVSVAGSPIANKIEALKCYKRECRGNPHPRSPEGIYRYAEFRGLQAGFKLAEAFMLIRELKL